MTLIYRTAGAWGAGKGSNLVAAEVDANFYELVQAIDGLTAAYSSGVSIDYITQDSATSFTFHMTDHTTQGPFTIPTATWNFRGPWAASTYYVANDVVTYGGGIYLVLFAHLSGASTFDPNDNDGAGHSYYQLILQTIGATVQTISADTWSPGLGDAFTYNRFTHPSSCIMTLLANSSTPFAIGTEISGRQAGSGNVYIEGLSGTVTVNVQEGCDAYTPGQGSTFTVKKVDTNEWDLFGHLALV